MLILSAQTHTTEDESHREQGTSPLARSHNALSSISGSPLTEACHRQADLGRREEGEERGGGGDGCSVGEGGDALRRESREDGRREGELAAVKDDSLVGTSTLYMYIICVGLLLCF